MESNSAVHCFMCISTLSSSRFPVRTFWYKFISCVNCYMPGQTILNAAFVCITLASTNVKARAVQSVSFFWSAFLALHFWTEEVSKCWRCLILFIHFCGKYRTIINKTSFKEQDMFYEYVTIFVFVFIMWWYSENNPSSSQMQGSIFACLLSWFVL